MFGVNMKIGFIGAGKAGTSFGAYLVKNGLCVSGYYSRSLKSSMKAAAALESRAFTTLNEVILNSDIVFITTPDDIISDVSYRVAELNLDLKDKVFAHMSGVLPAEVLNPLKEKGAAVTSIHPLLAFADIDKAIDELDTAYFSIQGELKGNNIASNILDKTGNYYFYISAKQKPLYHAAACIVSNYLVALLDYGLDMFKSAGVNKNKALEAIKPLVYGTLDNIFNFGTTAALTGPISRGDIKTIKKHIDVISELGPNKLSFYKLLGSKTVKVAEKKNKNLSNAAEIIELLK